MDRATLPHANRPSRCIQTGYRVCLTSDNRWSMLKALCHTAVVANVAVLAVLAAKTAKIKTAETILVVLSLISASNSDIAATFAYTVV